MLTVAFVGSSGSPIAGPPYHACSSSTVNSAARTSSSFLHGRPIAPSIASTPRSKCVSGCRVPSLASFNVLESSIATRLRLSLGRRHTAASSISHRSGAASPSFHPPISNADIPMHSGPSIGP